MLQQGDLSWVVPDQIIAFSSPQDPSYTRNMRVSNNTRPDHLIDQFLDMNVKGIIRLNDRLYDAGSFTRHSIQVHEMEFPDGSCPQDHIIRDFIALTESYTSRGQAVAVHCRAGLGRTGTLIGLYIMHKFGFDAKPLIAWMRICRTGMVVGEQQQFLVRTQNRVPQIMRSAPSTTAQAQNFNRNPAGSRDFYNEGRLADPGAFADGQLDSQTIVTTPKRRPAGNAANDYDRDVYSSAKRGGRADSTFRSPSANITYSYKKGEEDLYDRVNSTAKRERYNETAQANVTSSRKDRLAQY